MALTNDEKAYLWEIAKQAVESGETCEQFVERHRFGFKVGTLRRYYKAAQIVIETED